MSQKPFGAYSSSKTWLSKINLTDSMRFFQGGIPFVLVFRQSLEIESARAEFGGKAVADMQSTTTSDLTGIIPGKFFMA